MIMGKKKSTNLIRLVVINYKRIIPGTKLKDLSLKIKKMHQLRIVKLKTKNFG